MANLLEFLSRLNLEKWLIFRKSMSHSLISEYISLLVAENVIRSQGLGFKTSMLLERLLEGKIEQAMEKNKNNPELVRFLQFAKEKGLQPKYIDLAIKGWNERTEAFDYRANLILRVIDEFEGKIFQHLVPIEKKDVGKYKTWNEFNRYVISDLRQIANRHYQEKDKEKKIKQGGKKIFEDETYVLLEPKTVEASCMYGSGTKWCISGSDEEGKNYFDEYASKGVRFLFIMNKKNNDKDAIAFSGDIQDVEIYDAGDNSKDEIYLTRKYPSYILEEINNFLEPIIGRGFLIINYEELFKNPLSFMFWEEPRKIFNLEPNTPETFHFIKKLASTMPENPQMRGSWMNVVEKLFMRYVMSIDIQQGLRQGQDLWLIMQKDPIGASWSLPAVPERMVMFYALLNDMNARYHDGLSGILKAAALCAIFIPNAASTLLGRVDLDALEKSTDPGSVKQISDIANQLRQQANAKIPTKLMALFDSVFPSYVPSGDLLHSLMIVKELLTSLNVTDLNDVRNYLVSSMSATARV